MLHKKGVCLKGSVNLCFEKRGVMLICFYKLLDFSDLLVFLLPDITVGLLHINNKKRLIFSFFFANIVSVKHN